MADTGQQSRLQDKCRAGLPDCMAYAPREFDYLQSYGTTVGSWLWNYKSGTAHVIVDGERCECGTWPDWDDGRNWGALYPTGRQDDSEDRDAWADRLRARMAAEHAALASLRADQWAPLHGLTNPDALAAFEAMCRGRLWEPGEADEIVKLARMTQRIDQEG